MNEKPETVSPEKQLPEDFEILELDERLDMAMDPLSLLGDKCCGANNCSCCP